MIDAFFDEQVIETQNKLILAVSCYISSEWFIICSKVASFFYKRVTLRIKEAIGIDSFKKKASSKQKIRTNTWAVIKDKFEKIIDDLNVGDNGANFTSGEEILKQKFSVQVISAIRRQMGKALFLVDENSVSADTRLKIPFAVVTNLGPESNFATLDNDLKRSGNSTTLKKISGMHVIQQNKLYKKDRWNKLDISEKKNQWKWARSSEECKRLKEMEEELKNKMKALDEMVVEAKKVKKARNTARVMNALEKCKRHGGPVTIAGIDRLENMTDEQVKNEATFLKLTTGPNIRYRRKVGEKLVNYSTEELRLQIREVIKPDFSRSENVDMIIKKALCSSETDSLDKGDEVSNTETSNTMEIDSIQGSNTVEGNELCSNSEIDEPIDYIGKVCWWISPFVEHKIGVALDKETLQLYQSTKYGFTPEDTTVKMCDYVLDKEITDFFYIERRERIFLVI